MVLPDFYASTRISSTTQSGKYSKCGKMRKNKSSGFEDQLASWSELVKHAEQTLKEEINRLEDIHAREETLWKDIKL